jgi:hypothetical protein
MDLPAALPAAREATSWRCAAPIIVSMSSVTPASPSAPEPCATPLASSVSRYM